MKRYLLITLLAVGLAAPMLTSCSEDELSKESVITVDKQKENEFDKWLKVNFVGPYNLNFKYRYDDKETDQNYYHVPADMNMAIKLAHLVKYLCLETYDELVGINFTRAYFPKMLYLDGEFEYNNDGTYTLGTAEGGKKIFLAGVNYLDQNITNPAGLNRLYFKTMHHEFTHILNQTKSYPASFQLITGSGYVADSWNSANFNSGYLTRGFISAYAQKADTEDFAEMVSLYVTNSADQWNTWMKDAGEDGSALLEAKLQVVRDYMKNSWNIDLDQLRNSVIRRQADIAAGKVDLTDISVE